MCLNLDERSINIHLHFGQSNGNKSTTTPIGGVGPATPVPIEYNPCEGKPDGTPYCKDGVVEIDRTWPPPDAPGGGGPWALIWNWSLSPPGWDYQNMGGAALGVAFVRFASELPEWQESRRAWLARRGVKK